MNEVICVHCKSIGKPKRKKRGSTKWEVIGWLSFPLGLPYTLWRMLAARQLVCKHCGAAALLPVDGIAGQRLVKIAAGENVAPVAPAPSPATPPEDPIAPPKKPPADPNAW